MRAKVINKTIKPIQKGEKGFSLVELLVVVAILAILAAIAIPLFLNQKAKASDAMAISDGNTIAKEISSLLGSNPAVAAGAITFAGTAPTLTNITVGGNAIGTTTIPVSSGSTFAGSSAATGVGVAPVWCFTVTQNSQTAIYDQSGYRAAATSCASGDANG